MPIFFFLFASPNGQLQFNSNVHRDTVLPAGITGNVTIHLLAEENCTSPANPGNKSHLFCALRGVFYCQSMKAKHSGTLPGSSQKGRRGMGPAKVIDREK